MGMQSWWQNGKPHAWLGAVFLASVALSGNVTWAGAPTRSYRVAVLTPGMAFGPVLEGLREGFTQLGYHKDKDITLIIEDAHGEVAGLAHLAARLVEAQPDVIFTVSTAPTIVAKQVTSTLPIVFAFVADPLRSGLIASYASSRNNVTGITSYAGPLAGKRLEILQEIVPGIKRVLILVAPQEQVAEASFQAVAEASSKLGIELVRHDVTSKQDLEQKLQAVPQGAVDAIFYNPSNLIGVHRELLINQAIEQKIPLVATDTSMVEQGALVSYGSDMRLLGRQAAKLVVKILKGAKPSEIPVQTPEQLPLSINLSTAKAIGLTIPHSVLERTERIME